MNVTWQSLMMFLFKLKDFWLIKSFIPFDPALTKYNVEIQTQSYIFVETHWLLFVRKNFSFLHWCLQFCDKLWYSVAEIFVIFSNHLSYSWMWSTTGQFGNLFPRLSIKSKDFCFFWFSWRCFWMTTCKNEN